MTIDVLPYESDQVSDLERSRIQEHGQLICLPGPMFGGSTAEDFISDLSITNFHRVNINASAVEILDAIGVRVLAGLAQKLNSAGIELAIIGARRPVRILLAAAGLHKFAELYED